MIEHIEHFRAELQLCPLGHLPVFHDGEVHVIDWRPGALARSGVSKGAQFVAIPSERFGIEPLIPRGVAQMAGLAEDPQGPARKRPVSSSTRYVSFTAITLDGQRIP